MKHGTIPSPILPDGTLLLLPKPSDAGYIRYDELHYNGTSYLDIIRSLNPDIADKLKDATCFPTPDLFCRPNTIRHNWQPHFTLYGPSEGHLNSQKVGVGDIFLFFGWFKKTEYDENNTLRYVQDAPDLHIIFSYLQIGTVIKNRSYISKKYAWQRKSLELTKGTKHYSIYIPTTKLSYNNKQDGYGLLDYENKLVLTKEGHSYSQWELPDLFLRDDVTISYHNNTTNGFIPGKNYFQSSNIGQEFVVNGTHDLKAWVCQLICNESPIQEEEYNILSQVNHINTPNQDGYIYCRKRNKVMKVDSTACKLCQCYHNLIGDNSISCYWTDYLPAPIENCLVDNPKEEYQRVNWLLDKQFIPKLNDTD